MDYILDNKTVAAESREELISDEALLIIEIISFIIISGTVCLFGCVVNYINVIVFVKQGFRESATISLVCMSVSDFFLCLITVATSVTHVLNKLQLKTPIDVRDIGHVFSMARGIFNDASMGTIVFLSLERCLSVMKPLTFKHTVRRRTVLALSAVYAEVIIFNGFSLATTASSLTWQHDPTSNSSILRLSATPLRDRAAFMHQIVNGICFPIVSMGLNLAASCFLAYGLKKASEFRMQNSYISEETHASTLSPKEIRVIKMVIYVSAMFLLSYLPFLALFFARFFLPGVRLMGYYHNLNETWWAFIYVTVSVNASFNIFVYVHVSTKYREIFLQMFCRNSETSRSTSTSRSRSRSDSKDSK